MINLTITFVTCMLTLKTVNTARAAIVQDGNATQPPLSCVNRSLQGGSSALNTESAQQS